MKPKRTRTEYNLERKINAYIRKRKNLYRYHDGGYDLRGLLQEVLKELDLTTPQATTARQLVHVACAH